MRAKVTKNLQMLYVYIFFTFSGKVCSIKIVTVGCSLYTLIVQCCIWFSVAVKKIKEIMAGVEGNSNPTHTTPGTSQPQRMSSPSPMATPAFNQPLVVFDRQPLPPGVSKLILDKKIKQSLKKIFLALFCFCLFVFFLWRMFILHTLYTTTNYLIYDTYRNKLYI